MKGAFHVQGRLIERRASVIVRDETRRVDAESRDEAFRIAEVLRGGGFTVWIWAVDVRTVPASLELVERIGPDPPDPTRITRSTQRWVALVDPKEHHDHRTDSPDRPRIATRR